MQHWTVNPAPLYVGSFNSVWNRARYEPWTLFLSFRYFRRLAIIYYFILFAENRKIILQYCTISRLQFIRKLQINYRFRTA